jgi:hypothetical protein
MHAYIFHGHTPSQVKPALSSFASAAGGGGCSCRLIRANRRQTEKSERAKRHSTSLRSG